MCIAQPQMYAIILHIYSTRIGEVAFNRAWIPLILPDHNFLIMLSLTQTCPPAHWNHEALKPACETLSQYNKTLKCFEQILMLHVVRMISICNIHFWLEVHCFPLRVSSLPRAMDHPHCHWRHTPSYIWLFIHPSFQWSSNHVWRV